MSALHSTRTTVSYLQWIADDLSVAKTHFIYDGTGENGALSLIKEALDRINFAICAYSSDIPSLPNAISVSVLRAEEAVQTAACELARCSRSDEYAAECKSLVLKSSEALAYLKRSNGWT